MTNVKKYYQFLQWKRGKSCGSGLQASGGKQWRWQLLGGNKQFRHGSQFPRRATLSYSPTEPRYTNMLIKCGGNHPRYSASWKCAFLYTDGLYHRYIYRWSQDWCVFVGCVLSASANWRASVKKSARWTTDLANSPVFALFFGGKRLQGFLPARRTCGVGLRVLKLFFWVSIWKTFVYVCKFKKCMYSWISFEPCFVCFFNLLKVLLFKFCYFGIINITITLNYHFTLIT